MNDAGPAFPQQHVHPVKDGAKVISEGWHGKEGMTLRDYFAAKAMQSYLLCPKIEDLSGRAVTKTEYNLAGMAYLLADAMIIERNKKTEE